MAGTTVLRQTLKLGAGCGNSARPDLPGGQGVTLVPTGIGSKRDMALVCFKDLQKKQRTEIDVRQKINQTQLLYG